jgi:hypothetical protein
LSAARISSAKEQIRIYYENIPSLGKCEPERENKLEGVVKGEPVYSIDSTLKYSQECEYDPVLEIHVS